jgi:hypothetical protein
LQTPEDLEQLKDTVEGEIYLCVKLANGSEEEGIKVGRITEVM